MATKSFEIKIPEIKGGSWVAPLLSWLSLIALALIVFVSPIQQWLGMSHEFARGFGAGVVVALGLLIVISDRVSIPLVKQNNLGWVLLVLGVYFILWRSLAPLAQAVWSQLAPAHITFLVIGAVLVLVAILILKWRK